MKFKFGSFLSGFLAAGVLFSVSALAISGRMTLEVDPVNVQVNGEVFQPTDINGKEVPVFAYQGTTYAPLRALAEAYGLEVGYDAAANMATVNDPNAPNALGTTTTKLPQDFSWSDDEEEAYEQFKTLWEIVPYDSVGAKQTIYTGQYKGDLKFEDVVILLEKLGETRIDNFAIRLANEVAVERNMSLNYFGLSADSNSFYSIATKDGKSEIHERNWLFE